MNRRYPHVNFMIDTISNQDLFKLLVSEGFPESGISLADDFYAVPTKESLKKFGRRLYNFLSSNNLAEWDEEIWDCDDFAFSAKFLCSIDNKKHKSATKNDSSIGFGMAWILESTGAHAINIVVLKEKNNYVIKYLEPQIQDFDICLKEIPRKSFVSPSWCYF
jgi:hypothetical protein